MSTRKCCRITPCSPWLESACVTSPRSSTPYQILLYAEQGSLCLQVAKWLGERLMRPYRYKFVSSPQDSIMLEDLQTRQRLDAGALDTFSEHSLLLRRSTATLPAVSTLFADADAAFADTIAATSADEGSDADAVAAGVDDETGGSIAKGGTSAETPIAAAPLVAKPASERAG